jgi:hypothetical protein
MVDHIETVDPEILNNFVSVALGLRFTVEGLQDVIVDSMATVHHNILTNIAAGVCTENCSRQHGRAFKRWCNICRSWKEQLHKLCRHKNQWDRMKWEKIDIVDFVHKTVYSYESMAAVFVRDAHLVGQGIFQDLGAILSLFNNMTSFTIDSNIIADVQRTRNLHFAHNYKATLHRIDKEKCLDSMIKLLKVPEILCKPSAKSAIGLLEELRSSDGIPTHILQHPTSEQALVLIRNSFVPTTQCQSLGETLIPVDNNTSILERIDELISNAVVIKRNERSKFIPIMKTNFTCYIYAFVILVICMIFELLIQPSQKQQSSEGRWSVIFL